MMQDLIVEDVARELIFLGETVLQVRTRQHQECEIATPCSLCNRSGKEREGDLVAKNCIFLRLLELMCRCQGRWSTLKCFVS